MHDTNYEIGVKKTKTQGYPPPYPSPPPPLKKRSLKEGNKLCTNLYLFINFLILNTIVFLFFNFQ